MPDKFLEKTDWWPSVSEIAIQWLASLLGQFSYAQRGYVTKSPIQAALVARNNISGAQTSTI